MKRFSHSFVVPSDIDKVWDFYTDIHHLEVITPPHMRLKVVNSSTGSRLKEGTEVWIEGNLAVKSAWHSRITSMQQYVYVDEMLEGRFKTWKHTHAFRQVDGAGWTEVKDEIDFALRYGFVGRMLEGYAYRQLEKIFAHRKKATIDALK